MEPVSAVLKGTRGVPLGGSVGLPFPTLQTPFMWIILLTGVSNRNAGRAVDHSTAVPGPNHWTIFLLALTVAPRGRHRAPRLTATILEDKDTGIDMSIAKNGVVNRSETMKHG